MPSAKLKTPLEVDHYYHIYNRGNNKEALFYTAANYQYFMKRYTHYVADCVHTYAYCLIPNHFHFLIRVRSEGVSSGFQKFFQSYALSINKQENRSGSLFQKTFRRVLVQDNVYLKWLVFYIHHNPEKHFVSRDYREYDFSSYRSYVKLDTTRVCINEVLEWFGGMQAFLEFHEIQYNQKNTEDDSIET